MPGKETKIVRTFCGFNDQKTCGLSVHVKDGVITKITPGDFPDSKHKGACAKALSSHHWVYHPDRLKHPLKRVGERGQGKWQRVSWDQALEEIAGKLTKISEKYGSTSVGWTMPNFPFLRRGGYKRLAGLTKGTFIDYLSLGDIAGPGADFATCGWWLVGEFNMSYLIDDPKFTIVWGFNAVDTDPPRWRSVLESKRKGHRVVTIDPRYTATAAGSDQYISIRPGTDGALALGMIHLILKKGLEDKDFILKETVGPLLVRADNGNFLRESDLTGAEEQKKDFMVWDAVSGRPQRADAPGIQATLEGRHTPGEIECLPAFQLLSDMVGEYDPERVSNITDVPSDIIQGLAVEYATQKPAALHRGWGMQRYFNSDLTCRAINTLAAVTGNMSLDVLPSIRFEKGEWPWERPPKTLHAMKLYNAISKGDPYPIKAVCFAWRNFVGQAPNTKRIVNELFPQLELIVVSDLFMSATAKYADYVLPAASSFESMDLVEGLPVVSPYLQLQQKVIEPLYESKSDFQIAAEMGKRMGFGEYFNKTEEETIEEILAADHPLLEGVTLERLKQGPVPLDATNRRDMRHTPTGRIEFYVERLKPFGQELPVYQEPLEIGRDEKKEETGLTFLTPHAKYRMHSNLANVPELLKFHPEPVLEMNPVDAGKRNVKDGDVVDVSNKRGNVKVKVKITEDIKAGVVSLDQGWWTEHYLEGHHNELTHETISPTQQAILGPNAAYYDVRVEVEKSESVITPKKGGLNLTLKGT